jgi:hypothetical protein
MTLLDGLGVFFRRQVTLTLTEPHRTFLTIFGTLILGATLISLTVHSQPLDAWLREGALFSGVAGFAAAGVAAHKRAPWLSWGASFGVITQALFAGFLICYCCAVLFNNFKPTPSFQGSVSSELQLLAWAGLALSSAWGIFRNKWWAYFGEIILIWAAVIATLSARSTSHGRSEPLIGVFQLQNFGYCLMFVSLNCELIKRGREQWRATRAAAISASA